jgi:hypothetical protein
LEDHSAFIFRVKQSKKNSHMGDKRYVAGEVSNPRVGGSGRGFILVWS